MNIGTAGPADFLSSITASNVSSFIDGLLSLECGAFAWLLSKRRAESPLGAWFTTFFSSLCVGTLIGGILHGFFPDAALIGHKLLWRAALISIGVTALAAWEIAWSTLGLSARASRASTLLFAGYVAVVSLWPEYWIAIINYLPPAILLAALWGSEYIRTEESPALMGAGGMALTFVAAGVQTGKASIHPVYFDHNALYHLIQAIALFMMFISARWFVSEVGGADGGRTRKVLGGIP